MVEEFVSIKSSLNKILVFGYLTIFLFPTFFLSNTVFADVAYKKEMEKIAKKHFEESIRFYRDSKISESKIELEKAIKLAPNSNEFKTFFQSLKDEEFVADKDEKFVDITKDIFEQGMKHYRKEYFDKASVEFERAIAINPKNEKVLKYYNIVKEKKPKNEVVTVSEPINPVNIVVKKNPVKKSKEHDVNNKTNKKEEVTDNNKKRSDELYKTGLIDYKNGKFDNAIFCFEQAIKLNPKNKRAEKSLSNARLKSSLIARKGAK